MLDSEDIQTIYSIIQQMQTQPPQTNHVAGSGCSLETAALVDDILGSIKRLKIPYSFSTSGNSLKIQWGYPRPTDSGGKYKVDLPGPLDTVELPSGGGEGGGGGGEGCECDFVSASDANVTFSKSGNTWTVGVYYK